MPALRRVRRDDRGAVATVVAIMLAGGVLLGSAASVVDVGQLFVERGEIQSGADAAVLAAARACATDTVDCSSTSGIDALVQRYADLNAADGMTRVVEVCGRLPGRLSACTTGLAGDLTDCLGSAPPTAQFIEVRLATEMPDGRFVLPPTFARAFSGGTFDGAAVGACARATWQDPPEVSVIAVSICELDSPILLSGSGAGTCETGGGPFLAALLAVGSGTCERTLPDDGIVPGRFLTVDEPVPPACEDLIRQATHSGDAILLPVRDPGDSGPFFRHLSVVPIVVTDFEFGPGQASWLSGHFAGPPVPLDRLAGSPIVELIG